MLDCARQSRSCELAAVRALGVHLYFHFSDRRHFAGQLDSDPRIPAAPFAEDLAFSNSGFAPVAAGRIVRAWAVADGSCVDTIDTGRRARRRRSPARRLPRSSGSLTSGPCSFQRLGREATGLRLGAVLLGFRLPAGHIRSTLRLLRLLFRCHQLLLAAGVLLLGRLGHYSGLLSKLSLFLRI